MRAVTGDRPTAWSDLPPGQHVTTDFPVVSTEGLPEPAVDRWTFTISTQTGIERCWDWAEFRALPSEPFTADLHSVLGWSKLATSWEGVPLQVLLGGLSTELEYVHVQTYGDYTTNLPLEDLVEMPTWVAFDYEDEPISAEHGGPARLLVPHLYLWKSAKWVRGIVLSDHDRPGTRERSGLHNYGDPWREQRRRGD